MSLVFIEKTIFVQKTFIMINRLKGILPYILGLFLVSSLVFFPELQGKKLGANDSVTWYAASKEYRDYADKGEEIKWTSRIFSGMPLTTIAGGDFGNFIAYAYGKIIGILPATLSTFFVTLLCCFASLMLLGVGRKMSFILSIAFGLNTWILDSLWASHPTKILSLAFMIPVLAGFMSFIRSRNWYGLIYIMVGLMLSIGYAHYQIVYYGAIMCVVFGVFFFYESIVQKTMMDFLKNTIIVLIVVVVGASTNIGSLLSINDYNKETMRGGTSEITKEGANSTAKGGGLDINYAFSWSYGVAELFNLFIPDASGGSSNYTLKPKQSKLVEATGQETLPFYWGAQPFTGAPNYLGAGVFFLLIFSFFYWNSRYKYLLGGLFFLSLMMGLGRSFLGFNELLFEYLPMYNKFRTPTMSFSILNVMTILIIGLAMKSLFESEIDRERVMKNLKYSCYTFIGIMVLGFVMVSNAGFSGDEDKKVFGQNADMLRIAMEDRESFFKSDCFRSLFVALAVAGLIYFYIKNSIKRSTLVFALGLILFLDSFTVYKRYLSNDVFQKVESNEDMIPNEPYNETLNQDKSHFRIFNTTANAFNDNTDGFRYSNIGGYSPAKLYRYQDLIDVHLGKMNMPVLNMLNTKYFIVDNQGQKMPQQNPDACGNAWFVSEVKFAKNANEEMDSIGTFNPKNTAWVDQRLKLETKFNGNTDPNATIVLNKFHPDRMEYTSNSTSGGYVVFSEIWYKGNEDWKIFIDGKEDKLVRTNYVLRGAYIPSGNHKVEMRFEPVKTALYKNIGRTACVILLLISGWVFYRKSKTQQIA